MTASVDPRSVPGIARVTELAAPPARHVPAETQGTLALDLIPREAVPERTMLRAISDRHGELDVFARRFCLALVEVLAGNRGPAQMLRCVTPPVYERLVNRSRALAGAGGCDQRLREARARMRSMHLFCPGPGIAEVSLHLSHGERSRAVAGRLELRHGAWTCVVLEFC